MIDHIPELVDAGIMSLKIEGRMKTVFYVGTIIRAYREAIDDYFKDPALYESKKEHYLEEAAKASYRGFTTGFYFGKPGHDEHVYTSGSYIHSYDFIGMVKEYDRESGFAIVEQRNKFVKGDKIEFISPKAGLVQMTVDEMYTMDGELVEEAPHPQQLLKIKVTEPVKPFDMMRKKVDK